MTLFVASPGRAQLTEADILRATRNLSAVAGADLDRARAGARAEGAGRFANPVLGFERQVARDPNAQSQDLLTLTWPIELSGRPAMERALARVDARWIDVVAANTTMDRIREALATFYVGLAQQRRARLLVDAQQALEQAAAVIRERVRAGESAGYDEARIRIELELSRSRVAEAEVRAEAARRRLSALVGAQTESLQGDFAVAPPGPIESALRNARRERADRRAAGAMLDHARRARRAARRAPLPDLSVTVGYNRQTAPTGHGYALGAELVLPFFDRRQALANESRVVDDQAESLLRSVDAAIEAEVTEAHARLAGLVRERDRFGQTETDVMLNAATAGYREGDRTLLELLDARRAALGVALRKLELDVAVRLADVALRRAIGAFQ